MKRKTIRDNLFGYVCKECKSVCRADYYHARSFTEDPTCPTCRRKRLEAYEKDLKESVARTMLARCNIYVRIGTPLRKCLSSEYSMESSVTEAKNKEKQMEAQTLEQWESSSYKHRCPPSDESGRGEHFSADGDFDSRRSKPISEIRFERGLCKFCGYLLKEQSFHG